MVRELIVTIDDELEKETTKYPEIDRTEVIRKAVRECIHCKEISKIYTAPIERAMLQKK